MRAFNTRFNVNLRNFVAVIALLLLIVSESKAVPYYWRTAAGSSTWSTAANWSTVSYAGASAATVPPAGSAVYIESAATALSITAVPTVSLLSLNIVNGGVGAVTLTGALSTITLTNTGAAALSVAANLTLSSITITANGATGTGALTAVLSLGTNTFNWNAGGSLTTGAAADLTGTTGTIGFGYAGAQTIPLLTISGAGTLSFTGSGVKTITSGLGSTLSATSTVIAGGTATYGGTAPVYASGVTLKYTGTGAQTTSSIEWPVTNGPTNVTVDNTSTGITLNSAKTVSGTLTMTAGNINTSLYTLTLGTSTVVPGTLNYTAGIIIGNFARWVNATGTAYLFPLGTAATYTNEAVIANFTNITAGLLTAAFTASSPGAGSGFPISDGPWSVTAPYTDGYWTLTPSNGLASTGFNLSLTGTGFTSHALNNNARILELTAVNGTYSLAGTQGADNSPAMARSGLTVTAGTAQIYALGFANNITLGNNYTIGEGGTSFYAGGTEFGSFANAVAALDGNNMPASGGVTIDVQPGYTETISSTLQLTQTGTSTNKIIFEKDPALTGADPLITAYVGTHTPATAAQDGIFALVGASYVTINGIDLKDPNTTNPATMEWGYGMFNASVTQGCQYDTIENCAITLSYVNNVTGSGVGTGYGPSGNGSVGIEATDALITAITTQLTITSAAGAHSYNGFYGNTLTNCYTGINIHGYNAATAYLGINNDIGGMGAAGATTGNTISTYGGGGITAFGIIALNQSGVNISNNTINNSGVSSPTFASLYGIYNGLYPGNAANTNGGVNASINYNTITLAYSGAGTSDTISPILNTVGTGPSATTSPANTVSISSNTITNCTNTGVTATCPWFGIINYGEAGTVSINSNTFSNNSTASTAGTPWYLITYVFGGASYNTVNTTFNANDNTLGMGTLTAASSANLLAGIYTSGAGGLLTTLNHNGNTFQGLSFSGAGTGSLYFIYVNTTAKALNANNNIFNNLTGLNEESTTALIYNAASIATVTVQGNYTTNLGNPATVPYVSTVYATGVVPMYGYYGNGIPASGTATISNNNFSHMSTSSGSSNLQISLAGINIGNSSASMGQTINIYDDTLESLYASAGAVYGIYDAGSPTSNIYQNRIYDLENSGTVNLTAVFGIGFPASFFSPSTGTAVTNVYNNLIGGLTAPNAGSVRLAIAGIYIDPIVANTTFNVYYNTVYLNASSAGTNFTTAALFDSSSATATSGKLDLRNNILDNNSTANGSGIAAAFKRAGTTATFGNYASTSNNNLFYGGSGGSNYIFYDGTNDETTLGAYQGVVTQDQASQTENTEWISTSGSSQYFLYESNYPNESLAYSNAEPLASPYQVDYFTNPRQNNPLYVGSATAPDIGAIEFCYVAPPTVTTPQLFCSDANPTVANLTTTSGTAIEWYSTTTPLLSAALASSTALVNDSVYYATQTSGGCQSPVSAGVTDSIVAGPPTASLPGSEGTTNVCSSDVSYDVPAGGAVTNNASYTWATSGTGTLSNTNTLTPTYTFGADEFGDVTLTLTANGNSPCDETASDYVIVNVQNCEVNYTWSGTTTDWTTSTNWTPTAPVGGPNGCSANVIIPVTGTQPIISAPISVGNIQINQGAQLTLNSTLSVCGDWTGGASTNATVAGTGLVVLNGSSPQTISGVTKFNELKTDNSNGVAIQSGAIVNIYNALDLELGTLDASSGTLNLLSTSVTQVAIIDNFSAGNSGTLTGNINAQRYYAAAGLARFQHLMGSPVSGPALSQFGASGTAGFVVPKADCDELQMQTGSPYGTVFSYHENTALNPNIGTCGEAQWKVETSGNAINGMGYSILKYTAGTLTLNGTANLSSSYVVSGYTPNTLTNSDWSNNSLQSRAMSSGWQLLSNPYSATLQLTTVNSDFDNQVQVWNTTGAHAGSYTVGMVGSTATIAPFQAFMVLKTAAGGSANYTINGTDRVRTTQTFYAQNDNELDIVAENTSTGLLDNTTIAFNQHATDGFDPQYDANKFGGSLNRHTLYSLNQNKWMAINVLNSVSTTSTVAVGFEPGATGNYTLSFNNLNTFDPTTYIMLEDKQAGIMYNIRNGNYQFSADSADEWNRFVLHFTPPAIFNTMDASCNELGSITVTQPGTANWNYTLSDNNNVTLSTGVLNQSSPLNVSAAAGTYTLTLTDNNGYTVTKLIQVNGAPAVTAAFNPSSTNATTQTVVSFNNASQNATSYSWNFGDGGSSNLPGPVYTYNVPGTYTVELTATNASGCAATASKTIIITANATGINSIPQNGISIWSYSNRVYVDFSQLSSVNAQIKIYNILGQELSNDAFTLNGLYQKRLDNMEAAYVIIAVKNNDTVITKKLFIDNISR